jgi:hypothetical protein
VSQVPTFDELMVPLFRALRDLGGSASISEIDDKVGELLQLPEEVLEHPHNPEKSNQTEFQYRLAWARTYLNCTLGKFLSYRFSAYRSALRLCREAEQVEDSRAIFCSVGAAG